MQLYQDEIKQAQLSPSVLKITQTVRNKRARTVTRRTGKISNHAG